MIYLKLLLTLSLPLLLGLGIVALIYRKDPISFLERIALAWGIGLGLLGMSMFTLSLLGIRLTLISSCLPALFATAGLVIFATIRKYPILGLNSARDTLKALAGIFSQPNRAKAVAEKLLVLLIILTVAFVFFDALVKPIVNFDDLWRQGTIAKIIFNSGQVLSKQNMELAREHPYLNPLAQAWIYFGIGIWDDALGKIVFALCFLALLMVFYTGLKRYSDRSHSLLFTFLLTTFPLIVYHAGTAYSDLMQTFYYTAGAIFLYHWFKTNDRSDLFCCALLLGSAAFVKQLGIPLWFIAAFALGSYIAVELKRQFRPLLQFFLLSGLTAMPWLINKQNFISNQLNLLWQKIVPAANTAAPPVLSAPFGPPTLSGILSQLGRRMFFYADWQMLWFVLLLSLIFYWEKFWNSSLKYLGLMLLLGFLMMIYGFTEQNAYTFLVDGTLVQRMMMYQVPLALFLTALCLCGEKEKCL